METSNPAPPPAKWRPQNPAPSPGTGKWFQPRPSLGFTGLRKASKNSQHTWAGQVGESFLTLFFSNFQFSSWAKIWSTTAMASFP